MKWLAILLMIANVALYLWMSGHQGVASDGQMPARPEVNRAGMVLLSELKKPSPAVPAPQPETLPAPAPGAEETASGGAPEGPGKAPPAEVAAPAAPPEPVRPAPAQPPACFRVGPFSAKERLEEVAAALRKEGADFRVVQSRQRQFKATRVYLGLYAGRAEASAMVARLKGMGVDAYPYRTGGRYRVSLGYFTQEELARKYTTALARKGIDAKTEPDYKTLGPFDWLEIRVPAASAGSIGARDWGDSRIEVKRVDCRA